MASGHEIIQYIRDVNRKFELDQWIQFHSTVEEAVWHENSGKWKLRSKGARRFSLVDSLMSDSNIDKWAI